MSDYEQKSSNCSRMRTRNRSLSSNSSSISTGKNDLERACQDRSVTLSGRSTSSTIAVGGGRSKLQKSKSLSQKRGAGWQLQAKDECTFFDVNFWQREQICCGTIFRNRTTNMVLIDAKQFRPCVVCPADSATSISAKQGSSMMTVPNLHDLKCGDTAIGCELSVESESSAGDESNNKLTANIVSDCGNSSGISSGMSSTFSDGCSITTEEDEEDSSNSSGTSTTGSGITTINLPTRTFGIL